MSSTPDDAGLTAECVIVRSQCGPAVVTVAQLLASGLTFSELPLGDCPESGMF